MSGATGNQPVAYAWAVAIHVVIAAALVLGIRWPSFERSPVGAAPIQATLIDPKAITQQQQQRDREQQRKLRDEQAARDAAEQKQRADEQQKQREKAVVEKREQQRLADEQKKRDDAAQKQREKDAAAKREQEQVAQQQRDKAAADKRAKDDAARKQREAAAAAKAQADAQAAAAAAEAGRKADLLDKYLAAITNKIERSWIQPPSAQPGLECMVHVVQVPGGVVADVHVQSCNGDDAVVRSIEAAVLKASPLPTPEDMSMFDRNLNVRFRPTL